MDHRTYLHLPHDTRANFTAYTKLSLPANAPFKLQEAPGKNWGIFTTKFIAEGTEILREDPYFVVHTSGPVPTESDQVAMMQEFARLSPSRKQQMVYLCQGSSPKYKSMLETFNANIHTSTAPGSSDISWGFFMLQSRINHSCSPNTSCLIDITTHRIHNKARKDIHVGEEITFAYLPDVIFQTKQQRQQCQHLRFTCKCAACHLGPIAQQASDGRRLLIGALQFLLDGNNALVLRTRDASMITDSRLRAKVLSNDVALTSRLFYTVLLLNILDAERGLSKDECMRWCSRINALISCLQTTRNRIIMRRIKEFVGGEMLQHLQRACELWGRGDKADAFSYHKYMTTMLID